MWVGRSGFEIASVGHKWFGLGVFPKVSQTLTFWSACGFGDLRSLKWQVDREEKAVLFG